MPGAPLINTAKIIFCSDYVSYLPIMFNNVILTDSLGTCLVALEGRFGGVSLAIFLENPMPLP